MAQSGAPTIIFEGPVLRARRGLVVAFGNAPRRRRVSSLTPPRSAKAPFTHGRRAALARNDQVLLVLEWVRECVFMPTESSSPDPSRLIGIAALVVGGIAFLLGYIGPLIVSYSNLGPLLGIFVTGPLGLLGGGLAGILMSARKSAGRIVIEELKWLLGAWSGALLFTLGSSIVGISWMAILAQLAAIITATLLFYFLAVRLPSWLKRRRAVVLLGAALILLTSIFPPLEMSSDGAMVGYFRDSRFDATTRVPEYSVSQLALLLTWTSITAAVGLILLVAQKSGSGRY